LKPKRQARIWAPQYFEATKIGRYARLAKGAYVRAQKERAGAPWAIVLAGGEGVRLLPLVRQVCGMNKPKQLAKIVGTKSQLRHTLDRVGLQIPAVQTVIVTCGAHGKYMTEEFVEMRGQRILVQPEDRRTAAGVLFPAH
jgi:hypothetical protein